MRARPILLAILLAILGVAAACGVGDEGVPPGKLAVVGDVVIGPEDLAGTKAQLGAYAQLRFSGDEGRAAMLQAVIDAELLAQTARERGLADDPRVQWAEIEEVAAVYESTMRQRRVPREAVARDTAALRAYYEAHAEAFTAPERRNLEGVVFLEFAAAERALDELRLGIVALEGLGEIVATPLQARDDVGHPGFHALLFDAAIGPGELLAAPAMVGQVLIVGRVQTVERARLLPIDDPSVHERLVAAVAAPREAAARAELMAELAQRWPEQAP